MSPSFVHDIALLVSCLALFVVAKAIKDLTTSYSLDHELTQRDNVAVGTSLAGYMLGTAIVLLGALIGPTRPPLEDLMSLGGYGLLGIGLLNLSRWVNDRIILSKFDNVDELIRDRNVGTGAAEFGSYVASGLVVAGSIHGEGGSLLSTLATFVAAQVVLVVGAKLYEWVTPYSVQAELRKDNAAVGISLAGILIALGVITMSGSAGDFVSWSYNSTRFAGHALAGLVALPIVRFVFDRLLLPAHALDREIANDANVGAALLEAVTLIAFATFMYFTFDPQPLLALVVSTPTGAGSP